MQKKMPMQMIECSNSKASASSGSYTFKSSQLQCLARELFVSHEGSF